jgi:hypothetical protein
VRAPFVYRPFTPVGQIVAKGTNVVSMLIDGFCINQKPMEIPCEPHVNLPVLMLPLTYAQRTYLASLFEQVQKPVPSAIPFT